jgi:hypothetical protein
VGKLTFSAFRIATTGATKLSTQSILPVFGRDSSHRDSLLENYNAFNRGPQRSVIALMMFSDLRRGKWAPGLFTPQACAEMYVGLEGSYQAPKVIQLYLQQCFGSLSVLPIDNWIETFVRWPLGFNASKKSYHQELFASCDVWGKAERLIWLAAQSRKVHSSVAANILWCIRYGEPANKKRDGRKRGANPLSCKICDEQIRGVCPAFSSIRQKLISFNQNDKNTTFRITSSGGDNVKPSQLFVRCEGPDLCDVYSVPDKPAGFQKFPAIGHTGDPITVEDFVKLY